MPLLEFKKIYKTYFGEKGESDQNSTPVLKDINFKVEQGEFISIMGPSGSGKSTLLHILGFLDIQTEGDYFFEGKNNTEYTDDEMAYIRNRKMGFVFQSFNLLPRTSVLENVKLPLLYSKMPEGAWAATAQEAVRKVGLSHRLNYGTSQLSGGERQRVAIARALVNNPEVIFADEPTGNLDSKSGKAVMEILQELNQNYGHTIILITHESSTAQYAKRIIKIFDGQIESDRLVEKQKLAKDEYYK